MTKIVIKSGADYGLYTLRPETVETFQESQIQNNIKQVFQKAHKERVHENMIPSSRLSRLAEGNSVVSDITSLIRNSMKSGAIIKGVDASAKVAGIIGVLAIGQGVMGVFTGLNMIRNSKNHLYLDYQRGNWEGGGDHGLLGLMGASFVTFSAGMVVSNAAIFAKAAATAAAGGAAITVGGLVLFSLLALRAALGLIANHLFRSRLVNQLEGKGMYDAMSWLQNQVKFQEKVSDAKLQKKWDQFAFRTSNACCRLIREKITSDFLGRLQKGDAEALENANFILQEVKRANAKQLFKHYLLMSIAILGIAAFVFTAATGPFFPLLFAIGAILWLAIDSSKVGEKLGDLFFGKSAIREDEKTIQIVQTSDKMNTLRPAIGSDSPSASRRGLLLPGEESGMLRPYRWRKGTRVKLPFLFRNKTL